MLRHGGEQVEQGERGGRRRARHKAGLPPGADRLTPREAEVWRLVARGLSNTEIAADLFVGEATVKTHVPRIMAKLGARDRI
ncbi:helix-turn-helix domain-containing protein [Microbispora rosea]|uniref:helix-turn-helix domain-containing protein n=1 Tax=Microbispora rosea TaxID=58117 RepID=UPI003F4DB9FA